ncbi:peptidylprolyl isomerase [Martiniozyma asiatica (nom. inval.)]|nr:peptidylprolyl isomerase [Martiniozyma asiatica]
MSNKYTGLPNGWTIQISKTHNQEYYLNRKSLESQWEPPAGTDQSKLDEYLGKKLHRPQKVRCRHLLVKHKDVRRPSSWKEENITRTKEDAIEKLKSYKDEIERGDATLEQLAIDNSDCSSHAKGGDLGLFGRGEMQPSFEKAAFALQVGEMSDVVESDSGVHLIERIG